MNSMADLAADMTAQHEGASASSVGSCSSHIPAPAAAMLALDGMGPMQRLHAIACGIEPGKRSKPVITVREIHVKLCCSLRMGAETSPWHVQVLKELCDRYAFCPTSASLCLLVCL